MLSGPREEIPGSERAANYLIRYSAAAALSRLRIAQARNPQPAADTGSHAA